ncbi:MAG: hypothetical protein ACRYFS_23770 [Janthinobacterium lividum]
MLLRVVLVLALAASAGYGCWEIRRWSLPGTLITVKQKSFRLWGLFFLLSVLGLWLGGTYLHLPHPGDKRALIRWIQYWMLTVLASLPLIPLALLDWRENLRLLAENRRKLFQETLGPLAHRMDPPS